MKVKNIIYSTMILLILASCNKEEDHYESKNVKVDSVFDKKNETLDDKENQDNNDSNQQEDNQENKEDNNQNQEENVNGDEEKENSPDSNNNESENQDKKKYKATNSLNLRTAPNTNADNIILAIELGTEFEAIEELEANGRSWVKLEYQGKTGYVVKDLLEEVNN